MYACGNDGSARRVRIPRSERSVEHAGVIRLCPTLNAQCVVEYITQTGWRAMGVNRLRVRMMVCVLSTGLPRACLVAVHGLGSGRRPWLATDHAGGLGSDWDHSGQEFKMVHIDLSECHCK